MGNLLEILHKEVVPAEGCTEPIAVAYAVSLAAELLEEEITGIQLHLSGNIIKNAMGVGILGQARQVFLSQQPSVRWSDGRTRSWKFYQA